MNNKKFSGFDEAQEHFNKIQNMLEPGSAGTLRWLSNLCFFLDLIDEKLLESIRKFNTQRNMITHRLILLVGKNRIEKNYDEIKSVARLGRDIQLKLSPLNHSTQDIERILSFFDNPNLIPEEDT